MERGGNTEYKIGSRGHFCGGCDKTQFLHAGCVTDNTFRVSPDDPAAVAARAARDARLNDDPAADPILPAETEIQE